MPLTIKQIVSATPRKNKLGERRLRATKPNRRAELNYASELLTITNYIKQQTKEILLPVLKEQESQYGYTKDGFAETIEAAIKKLAKSVSIFANTKARYMAARAVARTKNATDAQLVAAARMALGIDIGPVLAKAPLKIEIEAAIIANTNLIKSLPTTYITQLRPLVLDGIQHGIRFEVLQKEILAKNNVTESRAKLIARDQIAKLNSSITEARQTQLGITKYEWQTSGDERVRTSHEANDGKVFSWDNPPATGHPGQDFQCRCVAIPVFDL